ncbi:MAG: sigma-70 family RNA polymerase sigma factor [Planctomycetes bacterium]|nr:sigma-70 family RNA polymerase sigma factor [Planctomycetota bacterium]
MDDIPFSDIRLAREGDPDASRRIVEQLQRPIIATIHRFLGRRFREDVEDIAQDVFLKLFRALDRFDEERGVKFTTWAFTFVKNHCFDVLKKRRISAVSIDSGAVAEEDEGQWELADGSVRMPPHAALDSELGARIEAAIESLSPDHRMVFILREYEQMDLKSIAEAMEVSEGTIKSRLHRAKQALIARLEPYLKT